MTRLDYAIESWPLKTPFSFAGHTVRALEALRVTLTRDGHAGQGEGLTPIVFPVSMAQMEAAVIAAAEALDRGEDIDQVCAAIDVMPARNAVDCALWDLRAKESGRSIWALAGLPDAPARIEVDQTIGLGSPDEMGRWARTSGHRVLKIKLDASQIGARLEAVRAARPDAELIVDANQSWSVALLTENADLMQRLNVRMVEQPLPPGVDRQLAGLSLPVPIYADESCHVAADVDRLKALYQGVNIKLDKTGGLTEALKLARAARAAGMGVMVGCMSGTSLSMAPAYVIGALSDWADLDGPLQLQSDRSPAMTYENGHLTRFEPGLWG